MQVIFHQTCFGTEVSLLDEFAARIYEELDYNKVIQFPSPFSLNMGPFKGFIMKYIASIYIYIYWLVVSNLNFISTIYGMSSFPLTFNFPRWLEPPSSIYDTLIYTILRYLIVIVLCWIPKETNIQDDPILSHDFVWGWGLLIDIWRGKGLQWRQIEGWFTQFSFRGAGVHDGKGRFLKLEIDAQPKLVELLVIR